MAELAAGVSGWAGQRRTKRVWIDAAGGMPIEYGVEKGDQEPGLNSDSLAGKILE